MPLAGLRYQCGWQHTQSQWTWCKWKGNVSCQCERSSKTKMSPGWKRSAACFPRYRRRFQGSKSTPRQAFGKAGMPGVPRWPSKDALILSKEVTLSLRSYGSEGMSTTHPPLARLEPRCLGDERFWSTWRTRVFKWKNRSICVYICICIYIYMCVYIYNDMALNWPSCDRLEVDGQSFPFTWRPGSEDVVLKVENFLEERVPNGVPPSAAKQKAAPSSPDDN